MGDVYGQVKESLGCGARCMQIILFIFNFIVCISGIVLVGCGIYMAVAEPVKDIQEILAGFSDHLWYSAVGIVITVGVFVTIIAFMGWYGAKKESTCLLCTYSCILLILFLLELTAGTLVAVMEGEIKGYLQTNMVKQVKTGYVNETAPGLSHAWNYLQTEMNCCGSINYTDYDGSEFVKNMNRPVPYKCCQYPDDTKDMEKCMKEASYYNGTVFEQLNSRGCYKELDEWLTSHAGIVYGIVFGFTAVQVMCIIMALCLRSAFVEAEEGSY